MEILGGILIIVAIILFLSRFTNLSDEDIEWYDKL
jgi:hypothetical protein